jgi:hypothetical protein
MGAKTGRSKGSTSREITVLNEAGATAGGAWRLARDAEKERR